MPEATDLKTHADFQKYNFFRTPAWRWDRVLKICDRGPTPGRCTRRDDDTVRRARNFLLRWRNSEDEDREKLLWECPGLYYAYDYYQRLNDEPEAAMYIEARLLARQTPEEIGKVMGILPDAVTWYADLFFDIKDRVDSRDWVTKQIIVPAMMRVPKAGDDALPFKDSSVAKPFLDGSLKLFAYFGGRYAVDVFLAGIQVGRPLASPDDFNAWSDGQWSTVIRRRSLQASLQFEVNKYNVMELFAVHTQIMALERSEDSSDQQRTTTERHIKAMIDEIPWAVGTDGEKLYTGSAVGQFDAMATELRDDELLRIASGQTVPGLADNFPKALPPPRKDKKSVLMSKEAEL